MTEAQPSAARALDEPAGDADSAPRPWWRRVWRVARWFLLGVAALLVLVVVGVWLVLANVNHPAVKSRIQALVKDSAGLEIDYDELSISLRGGVTARRFTVATPPELAEHAPHFVEVTDLRIETRLWTLPFRDLGVDAIRVGSLEVTVVATASGETTLTLLFPSGDKPVKKKEPAKPSTPLSDSLANLPSIEAKLVDIRSIRGTAIQVDGDRVVRRSSIDGLMVAGSLRSGDRGLDGTELRVVAARNTGGLKLSSKTPADLREGALELEVAVRAGTNTIHVEAGASVIEQGLITTTRPVVELLELELELELDREQDRTKVDVVRLSVLDDAVTARIAATIPDSGDGDIEIAANGSLAVRLPSLPVNIPGIAVDDLSLDVVFDELVYANAVLRGSAKIDGKLAALALTTSEEKARLSEVTIDGKGVFAGPTGQLSLTAGALEVGASAGDASASARALSLFAVGEVANDTSGIRQSSGNVTLSIGEARASSSGSAVAAGELELVASATNWLEGVLTRKPMTAEVTATIGELEARLPGRKTVAASRAKVSASVNGLTIDSSASATGVSGAATAAARVGSMRVRLDSRALVAAELRFSAHGPLDLSRADGEVGLGALTVSQPGSVRIAAKTATLAFAAARPLDLAPGAPGQASFELDGSLAALALGGEHRGGLPRLRIVAEKKGANAYRATVDARAARMVVSSTALEGAVTASVVATADLAAPMLDLEARIDGPGAAKVRVDADAAFVRRGARLRYDVKVSAESLDAVGQPLRKLSGTAARIELAGAKLLATASGDLGGVLVARRNQSKNQMPGLASEPLRTIRGKQRARIEARGIKYTDGVLAISVPAIDVGLGSTHAASGATDATLEVASGSLSYASGGDRVVIKGLSEKLVAHSDVPLTAGAVAITSTTRLASATQSYFADYEVANLNMSAAIDVDRLRSVFVRKLTLNNPGAGTRLTLVGGLERSGGSGASSSSSAGNKGATMQGRDAMTLEGELSQKVAPFEKWGVAKKTRGRIVVPFRVESGDLTSYRVEAKLIAKHVSLETAKLAIDDLNGVVPMVEELAVLPTGLVLLPGPKTNVLARTRFFDVHPFLDSEDYITAARLEVGGQRLGPIAGNMRLARSVFSIDQLQVGYRSGTITGQVRADYRDGDPRIAARLNITGVKPSGSGDVLDANAAVEFVPRSLELSGKVQIVRIGRDHLLELMDLLDPFHETVNVNKVRLGLKVGFPKFVRLNMHDGALDAKVELGGAGKLVRIDEIRSIPLGPLLQTYVAPVIDPLLPKDRK